ncbi:MAG: glycosyltransferase [Actinomycetota bacterium]|nr:glycosyltransferase [Actinomycetota bacterium]
MVISGSADLHIGFPGFIGECGISDLGARVELSVPKKDCAVGLLMKAISMQRLAIISYHTSPLVQPGTGDGGGMNVYVRQLASALARLGISCDVYTRAYSSSLSASIKVEPGFVLHHIPAGPLGKVSKVELLDHIDEFTENVLERIRMNPEQRPDVIHANYWLSGIAGHTLKHTLEVPLVTTFHTLEKVKARDRAIPDDDISEELRIEEESKIIYCSDQVLASCEVEAFEISSLYNLDRSRISIVPLGVDHAFFSPGDRGMARTAVGLPTTGKMVLFVGRIQPLKGADIAIESFIKISDRIPEAFLVMVGGPSGPFGADEISKIKRLVAKERLTERVYFFDPQPHEVLSSFYRAADVGIVPSRTESFGLVALEAAACGVPVVASDVGGLKTLVVHGSSGYLVTKRTAEEFSRYLVKVLDDTALTESLKIAANSLSASYRWRDAALRFQSVLMELTAAELLECG